MKLMVVNTGELRYASMNRKREEKSHDVLKAFYA